MNKNELIARVADRTNMSKTAAAEAVEATFAEIEGALKAGGEVRIVGFGNFVVAHRKASTGRNPRTGETVEVEEKYVPFFKTGKLLRDRLNGQDA